MLLSGLACGLIAGGCGGQGGSPSQTTKQAPPARHSKAQHLPIHVVYRHLFDLPAPLQDPASAPAGTDRFVLLGGLTAADTSSDQVLVANLHGTAGQTTLPNAQHDAQAANLGGHVYVFGGGQYSQYSHILSYNPSTNAITTAGALPAAASDVAVAAGSSTAYVIGGFDGANWLSTVLAYTAGHPVRVVAHLPVALRYAAAAVSGRHLLVAGGSTPSGASNAIYSVNLVNGSVSMLGRLPSGITHAAAGMIGSTMYLVGGRGDSLTTRRDTVYAIDPLTGRVRSAGRLPDALSDAAVIPLAGRLIVAGGSSETGTQSAVGELAPAG